MVIPAQAVRLSFKAAHFARIIVTTPVVDRYGFPKEYRYAR